MSEIPQPAVWQDRPRPPGISHRARTALSLASRIRPGTQWSIGRGAGKLCPSVRRHPLCRHLFISQTFNKCLWDQSCPEVHARSPLRPPAQTSALSITSFCLVLDSGAWLPLATPQGQREQVTLNKREQGRGATANSPVAAVQG